MSFDRLIGDPESEILLANLYAMVSTGAAPTDLVDDCLIDMEERLRLCRATAKPAILRSSAHKAVYARASELQVKGVDRPDLNVEVSAIVGFDKVLPILKIFAQRRPHDAVLTKWVGTVSAPRPPTKTIEEAADIINRYKGRFPDLTLTTVHTIFWAAPSDDIYKTITDKVLTSSGRWIKADLAEYLRDRLGLQHIRPSVGKRAQHLFLFQSTQTLAAIKGSCDLDCRRPTALDGIDNPRFSQVPWAPPRLAGCGLTIDLNKGNFAPGLPELALTPLNIGNFVCRYIGELRSPPNGDHANFLTRLAPGMVFADAAAELSRRTKAAAAAKASRPSRPAPRP